MARKIEKLFLDGPVGRLEALLEEPEYREPIAAVLVCHPHPQHGGTMHTKVVYRTARGMRQAGAVVLRFHYRGVNLSEGEYDHGQGEIEDGEAALGFLRSRYAGLPYAIAGFSFGSRIALKLAERHADAEKVVAIGYPTTYKNREYLAEITVPKVFVQSSHDEHGPMAELRPLVETLRDPKQLIEIPAKDHFFVDALDAFEAAIVGVGPLR